MLEVQGFNGARDGPIQGNCSPSMLLDSLRDSKQHLLGSRDWRCHPASGLGGGDADKERMVFGNSRIYVRVDVERTL